MTEPGERPRIVPLREWWRRGPRRFSLPRPQTNGAGLIETVVIVVLVLGLAIGFQAWIVKAYQVPSGSMEPTLDVGQKVLANRFIYHFQDPAVGDIVVFHPPLNADSDECHVTVRTGEACPVASRYESDQTYVKRIVAGPGDTLSIHNGHPVVNGVEKTDEPYIRACGGAPFCNLPKTIAIHKGHYFMMGDNRGASDDSRVWGPVPRDWIIGKVFATYWPPDRWGFF